LNEDFGLDWYAYGARYYDPILGRFTGVDPISDQFPHVSTYNYAENEPIANIDLWGLQKYYTSYGTFVGRTGDSPERRVLNQGIKVDFNDASNNDYNYFHENSRELLTRSEVDQKMAEFVENYQNADVEHLQIFHSKIFDDEDGSLFKGYLPGKIMKGDETGMDIQDDPSIPENEMWRLEISIHNHPNPNRHRFSKARPGGTFGTSLEGDYYMGVSLRMEMFLTTKNQKTILMFDPRKFFELLARDYERDGNTYRGQKIYKEDMNELGPLSVRTYQFNKN
jgi:RHS repeat-associated protein